MSEFQEEFSEKIVKKYINSDLWEDCSLADYYTYLEYYDEGGYSSVHMVMDRITGEHVVLKRSSKKDFDNSKTSQTLELSQEAKFLTKVQKKTNGIKLYNYYDDDDHYILIMQNGGRSLEDITSSHKKKILDLLRYDAYRSNFFYKTYLGQIKGYLIKVFHQIKSIHQLGIHHNDLKPENILVDNENIFIIDFGVSRPVKKDYNAFFGTMEYVPYEYTKHGSYKPWDHTVWCFGIMLHFLALMKYPFLKEKDVIFYSLNRKRINKLPPTFSALIYDCLAKLPSFRPLNLLERLENLEAFY